MGLLLILTAVFTFTAIKTNDSGWAEILLIPAAAFTIARLIHAEAIPGDRQFWITRPYRWQSLLAAKLLFVLAFINLPIFLAQSIIVLADRFPLASMFPGLLWEQILLLACLSFPIIAFAAVTSRIRAFIFAGLVLFTVLVGLPRLLFGAVNRWIALDNWPISIEWVRDSIAVLAITAVALGIFYVQYRFRATMLSRTLAVGALAAVALVYVLMPWQLAWAVEARLSKQPAMGESLRVAPGAIAFHDQWRRVFLDVPIKVTDVAAGIELRPDALKIAFRDATGQIWQPSLRVSEHSASTDSAGTAILHGSTPLDRKLIDQWRDRPLKVHGSLYFTVFGNKREKTIELAGPPANVMDGLQCYAGFVHDIFCRSAFRWPDRMVDAKGATADTRAFTEFISYSPFPAEISINPIATRWASAPAFGKRLDEITIVVAEPLAHVRRDFELAGVRLGVIVNR